MRRSPFFHKALFVLDNESVISFSTREASEIMFAKNMREVRRRISGDTYLIRDSWSVFMEVYRHLDNSISDIIVSNIIVNLCQSILVAFCLHRGRADHYNIIGTFGNFGTFGNS